MYYSNQFALQLAHLSKQNKRSRCRIHLMKNINLQQEKSGGKREMKHPIVKSQTQYRLDLNCRGG